MVIPIGVCTPTGPQRGARNLRTLFRVRVSWASLFRWYALKNARVPPAIVLSRLRRGKNGQTPDAGYDRDPPAPYEVPRIIRLIVVTSGLLCRPGRSSHGDSRFTIGTKRMPDYSRRCRANP